MKPRSKRLLAPLALALVAVLAGACASGTTSSGAQMLVKAVAETKNAKTAKIEGTVKFEGGGKENPLGSEGMKFSGALDFAKNAGTMEMDLGSLMPGSEESKIEMRFIGKVIYMKMPKGMPGMFGDKPWIKMDMETVGKQSGLDPSQLNPMGGGFGTSNPGDMLEQLEKVSDDVKKAGTADVRGVKCTKYDATIEGDKILDQIPQQYKGTKSKAELEKLYSGLKIPVTVYVDEDGLVRRQELTMDMTQVAKRSGGKTQGSDAFAGSKMVMQLDFFDFGSSVDVSAPPEAEVTDFSEILKGLGGAGGTGGTGGTGGVPGTGGADSSGGAGAGN